MKTVMIVAGESSGELYGSLLARELRRRWPDIRVIGIGGERMEKEGVELIYGISHSFGFIEVFSTIRKIREALKRAKTALIDIRPAICVLIDYPDFNFRLGYYARKRGIKVLYYVSPQVWAWRRGRLKKMKEIADRIAVVLPFEEEIYRREGIEAEFVGHPVMEEILERGNGIRKKREDMQPVIALLPGSRPGELKRHLPIFEHLVELIRSRFGNSNIILPLAPNIDATAFHEELRSLQNKGVSIVNDSIGALSTADMAVIASGTATLQAALLGVPMVVIYRLSPLTYIIGRIILNVRYISLVNILAGRCIVPELIQGEARPERIAEELDRLYGDEDYRNGMIAGLNSLRASFLGHRPSLRVADMIGEMAGWL
jgi:lipid-A-disaccharide synthase